jgi:hypothetical protein
MPGDGLVRVRMGSLQIAAQCSRLAQRSAALRSPTIASLHALVRAQELLARCRHPDVSRPMGSKRCRRTMTRRSPRLAALRRLTLSNYWREAPSAAALSQERRFAFARQPLQIVASPSMFAEASARHLWYLCTHRPFRIRICSEPSSLDGVEWRPNRTR